MKISNVSYNYNYILVANRYYNPRISRFYATDSLTEKYPGMSPYTSTADNPVMIRTGGVELKIVMENLFLVQNKNRYDKKRPFR